MPDSLWWHFQFPSKNIWAEGSLWETMNHESWIWAELRSMTWVTTHSHFLSQECTLDGGQTKALKTVQLGRRKSKQNTKKGSTADRKWHVWCRSPDTHGSVPGSPSSATLDTGAATFKDSSGNPATTHLYTSRHNQIHTHSHTHKRLTDNTDSLQPSH